jgi:quercetin dioxygenase-like cupin family protein
VALLAALSFAPFADAVPGRQPGPPVTVLAETTFGPIEPPGRLYLSQAVSDLPPGAATPRFAPGGQGFATVVEGGVTVRGDEGEASYRAGQSFRLESGRLVSLGNPDAATARVLMAVLRPAAAPAATLEGGVGSQDLPPGALRVVRASLELDEWPSEVDVVLRVVDFAPGVAVPAHVHPGPSFVTLLAGQVEMCIDGAVQWFGPGDSWLEPPGAPHSGVAGPEPARIAATTLVPAGLPLTRPVGHCTDESLASGGTRSFGSRSAR